MPGDIGARSHAHRRRRRDVHDEQPAIRTSALDARTGRQIWRYTRPQKVKNPYEINPYNRGVAVLGNRLFVGTLDAALVALDARTGLPMWEVQVADTMVGYSITSPPLIVQGQGASSASPAASSARADSSTPTTPRPASGSGGSTPFPAPANSATTRGRATAGRSAAARRG